MMTAKILRRALAIVALFAIVMMLAPRATHAGPNPSCPGGLPVPPGTLMSGLDTSCNAHPMIVDGNGYVQTTSTATVNKLKVITNATSPTTSSAIQNTDGDFGYTVNWTATGASTIAIELDGSFDNSTYYTISQSQIGSTNTSGFFSASGYWPWLKVNVTSLSGSSPSLNAWLTYTQTPIPGGRGSSGAGNVEPGTLSVADPLDMAPVRGAPTTATWSSQTTTNVTNSLTPGTCIRLSCSVDVNYRLSSGGDTAVSTDIPLPAKTIEKMCMGPLPNGTSSNFAIDVFPSTAAGSCYLVTLQMVP